VNVTLAELVDVVDALEGQTLSPRQVRYLEGFGVFHPRGRTVAGVRIYDDADVALACLIVRMRQADIPAWTVKATLAYVGESLREVFASGTAKLAVVRGARMLIVRRESMPPSRWTFDLRQIQQRATAAVRKLRAREPEVTWAGWHTMPARRAAQLMEATA
jgi:DNA-binding transcriptional MerR regulator